MNVVNVKTGVQSKNMEINKKEIFEEFNELVKAVEDGKLIRLCNSCNDFYKVNKKDFGFVNICPKCMQGVVIPTF